MEKVAKLKFDDLIKPETTLKLHHHHLHTVDTCSHEHKINHVKMKLDGYKDESEFALSWSRPFTVLY